MRNCRRNFIVSMVLAAAAGGASVPALCQGTRCGAGKDLVVQALERISPRADRSAYEDALQLLKHAVSECGELGDAWYYRSLVEQHLGHDALAKYALDKARFNGSEALQEGLNPLVLATPGGRGLTTEGEPEATPVKPPPPPGPVQQKWALVIGIGHFSDHEIPRLNYTSADANAIAAQLMDPAIGNFPAANVQVLIDEQATTRKIKEQLNMIARRAQPNDLVLIYVATHGTPRTMDTAGGANYLVTYDTEVYKAGKFDEDAMFATAYPMVELANAVATRMKALRTAVILDTCYSGGSMKNESAQMNSGTADAGPANMAPSQQMLARMSEGTGRIVMSASQVNEESLESDELRHGYFTYFLLQALKSDKGMAPLSQVYAEVAQQVAHRVSAAGLHQHPVISKSSDDADFALRAADAVARKALP